MTTAYKAPRTFGQLVDPSFHRGSHYGRCSCCKQCDVRVWGYSTRHYVCESCAQRQFSRVLPSIVKREAWLRRLDAIRAAADAADCRGATNVAPEVA